MIIKEIIPGINLSFLMNTDNYFNKDLPIIQTDTGMFVFRGQAKKALCLTNFFRNYNDKPPHSHEFFEIELCMKGRATHHMSDKTKTMLPGTAMFIPPNQVHSYTIQSEYADIFTLMFIPYLLNSRLDALLHSEMDDKELTDLHIPPLDFKRIITLCSAASNTFYYTEDVEGFRQIFRVILDMIYDVYMQSFNESQSETPFVAKIDKYINNHLYRKITVEEIAKHMCMETKYTSAKYSKLKGQTIVDYINHQRVDAAKMLLASTDLKIIDVSNKCGIENIAYFNRIFKKITGVTPSAFRKNCSLYHDIA